MTWSRVTGGCGILRNVLRFSRNVFLRSTAYVVACGVGIAVESRLGLWTPIGAHPVCVLAAVLATLTASTFLPVGRLLRRAADSLQQNRGEGAVIYLVTIGTAIAVAFLIVRPH